MKNSKISKNEAISEILACSDDPIYFIENYCKVQHQTRGLVDFKLYDYQKKTIKTFLAHRQTIVNKARQLGFTTLTAAFICWLILFHKDKKVLCVSINALVSKEMIDKIKVILNNLPDWMYLCDFKTNRAHKIVLSNGSSVESIARSENAGRSLAVALLVIDEAAIIRGMDEMWKGLKSTTSTGGKIIALSCVTKDTTVFTTNGPKQIGDFINKESSGSYEISPYFVLGNRKVRRGELFHNNGEVDTLKIKTKLSELECSTNHKLWACKDGVFDWFESKDLSVGDWLSVSYGMNLWGYNDDVSNFCPTITRNTKNIFSPKTLTPEICYLIGLYLSEGSSYKLLSKSGKLNGGSITITCGDDISSFVTRAGLKWSSHDGLHWNISSKNLIEFFEYLGFDLSKHAHEKIIPARLLEMSPENISAMMSGIFDGDGTAHKTKNRVSITLSSETLINQIRMILLNFGIRSLKNKQTKEKLNSYKSFKYEFKHDTFTIEINSKNSDLFFEKIGFNLKRKQDNRKIHLRDGDSKDVIPHSLDFIKFVYENSTHTTWSLKKDFNLNIGGILSKNNRYKTEHISKRIFSKFVEASKGFLRESDADFLEKIRYGQSCEWTQISSIDKSRAETFDFSLKERENDFWDHSVVYNGILGHQTPKGIGNWFYKTYMDSRSGVNDWCPLLVNWWENPEYAIDLIEDSSAPGGKTSSWFRSFTKDMTPMQIRQELLTEFLETGDTYFDSETIKYWMGNVKDPIRKEGNEKALWIWHEPNPNSKYLISADCATGAGEDYSTFHVIDLNHLVVCAEFKGKVYPDVFADILVDIARRYNDAWIAPENASIGSVTAFNIKNSGYNNLVFLTKEFRLVDKWVADYNGILPGVPCDLRNRGAMIAKLEEYLRKKLITVSSNRLINEMHTFTIINGKPQALRAVGCNDDLVMALAIGVWLRDIIPEFNSATASTAYNNIYDHIKIETSKYNNEKINNLQRIGEMKRKLEEKGGSFASNFNIYNYLVKR